MNGFIEFIVSTFPDGRTFTLKAEPYTVDGTPCMFMEQAFLRHCLQSSQSTIVKTGRHSLTEIYGNHRNYVRLEPENEAEVVHVVFSLASREHLVITNRPDMPERMQCGGIYLYDKNWQLKSRIPHPGLVPYGSQAIGQSYTGTVCYGEYANERGKNNIHLWRSINGGRSWHAALTLPERDGAENGLVARHFHVCQADPYLPGRWYAFTGDKADECHIFVSENDGVSWQKINPAVQIAFEATEEVKKEISELFARTTSLVFSKNHLHFATDDKLPANGGPVLCKMQKNPPYTVIVHRLPTKQEVRSLIDVDERCMVAITQRNEGSQGADILCIDKQDGEACPAGALPVTIAPNRCHNPVTSGYNSLRMLDGSFFTRVYNQNSFAKGHSTLKWTIIETTTHEKAQGCTVCDEKIRDKVCSGEGKILKKRSLANWMSQWEYVCPVCDSRTRERTAWQLKHATGELSKGKVLSFAAETKELQLLQAWLGKDIFNVALHEREGAVAGYDIRHLPALQDESYDYAYANDVMNYIPEVHLAAREIYRILKPSGRFFFNLMPYRIQLRERDKERVKVSNHNALSHEQYSYDRDKNPDGITNVPQLTFNLSWVWQCFMDAGFDMAMHTFWDSFSQRLDFWLEAKKAHSNDTL